MAEKTIPERSAFRPVAEHADGPVARPWSSTLLVLAPVLAGTALIALHATRFGHWIVDDAGITFAYARNVADGHGPVLQPGAEPVEGYSNPAWMALLAVGRLVGLFDRGAIFGVPDYVLFPKAVALLCCAGIVLGFHAAATRVTGRPGLATLIAAAVLAAVPSFVVWSFSGLENSLFALVVTWLAVVLLRAVLDDRLLTTRVALITGALVALAALTRPDGLIYAAAYPLVVLVHLGRPTLLPGVRHLALHAAAFGLPFGAYLLWRYLTFGLLVPNTAVAKSQKLPTVDNLDRIHELLQYVGIVPVVVLAVVISAAMVRPSPVRTGLVALVVPLVLAVAAFVILDRDWMGELRFTSPIWPLVALLGTLAAFAALSAAGVPGRAVLSVGLIAAVVSSGVTFTRASTEFRDDPTYPMCMVADRFGRSFNGYADILGIDQGSLLLPDLGGTAMTSRLHLIDMAGLAEPRIARFHRNADMAALRDYVFEVVKPTFIDSFGPWSDAARIPYDPRMSRDYDVLYQYPETAYGGDWVRKDAVQSPEKLQEAQAFASAVMSPLTDARWDSPLSECGPVLRIGQTPRVPE